MVTNNSIKSGDELLGHLQRQVHWKTVGLRLLAGLGLLDAVVWFGRHAVEEIKAMETWIAGHDVWGQIAFMAMIVVFTSMFVPDTVLAIAKVAGKANEHSTMHTVVTVVGFAVCIVLMISLSRIATKALADAEGESPADMPAEKT